jgi:hypothetical protein
MQVLWKFYSGGNITKEDLESTLQVTRRLLMQQRIPKETQQKRIIGEYQLHSGKLAARSQA